MRERLRAMTHEDGPEHFSSRRDRTVLRRAHPHPRCRQPDPLPEDDTGSMTPSLPTAHPKSHDPRDHRIVAPLPGLGGAPAASVARGRDGRDRPHAQHNALATPRRNLRKPDFCSHARAAPGHQSRWSDDESGGRNSSDRGDPGDGGDTCNALVRTVTTRPSMTDKHNSSSMTR